MNSAKSTMYAGVFDARVGHDFGIERTQSMAGGTGELTWAASTPGISLQHTYNLPLSSSARAVGPMPPESCANTVVTYAPSGRRMSRRILFRTGYEKKVTGLGG